MSSCQNNTLFGSVIQAATKLVTNKIQCLDCNKPLKINCDVIINGSLKTINNPWLKWTPTLNFNLQSFGVIDFDSTVYTQLGNSVILNFSFTAEVNNLSATQVRFGGLPITPTGFGRYHNSINIIDTPPLTPLSGLISIPGGLNILIIDVDDPPGYVAGTFYFFRGQVIYAVN